TLLDDLYGPGAPSYQGRVSDHLLPPTRDWRAVTRDDDGLRAAIRAEVTAVGGEALPDDENLPTTIHAGVNALRKQIDQSALVEGGIGCEACHGGSAEHVRDPHVMPSFEPRTSMFSITPPHRPATEAAWIDRTCAHCHTVLFTKYPWTWEGAARTEPIPGG